MTDSYFYVHRDLVEDKNLSWAARGMMLYILGRGARAIDLIDLGIATKGNAKYMFSLLSELEERGYIRKVHGGYLVDVANLGG